MALLVAHNRLRGRKGGGELRVGNFPVFYVRRAAQEPPRAAQFDHRIMV